MTTDGARWFFDAGAESLDFAYLGHLGHASPETPVTTPAELGRWLAERVERLDAEAVTDRDLTDAIALRDAIGRLAIATADGATRAPDDIDTVNLFAATPDVPPALGGGHRQAGAGRIRLGQALSSLARDAVAMLAEADRDPGRVRRCDAVDCRLVFHDESRTANRRWCSMQRCGNRAKVRAFRARVSTGSTGGTA